MHANHCKCKSHTTGLSLFMHTASTQDIFRTLCVCCVYNVILYHLSQYDISHSVGTVNITLLPPESCCVDRRTIATPM